MAIPSHVMTVGGDPSPSRDGHHRHHQSAGSTRHHDNHHHHVGESASTTGIVVPGIGGRSGGTSMAGLSALGDSASYADSILAETVSAASAPVVHYGTKPGHFETSKIYSPTSEGLSEVSERANE